MNKKEFKFSTEEIRAQLIRMETVAEVSLNANILADELRKAADLLKGVLALCEHYAEKCDEKEKD